MAQAANREAALSCLVATVNRVAIPSDAAKVANCGPTAEPR
jgi:hypothetical protein